VINAVHDRQRARADQDGQAVAKAGRVDACTVACDDAHILETPHTVRHAWGGQTNAARQLGTGNTGIRAKLAQNCSIDAIESIFFGSKVIR
tara:strand:- start:792 stop:1064 length:273 start_codon:yes stop_codon:yes gene_type:complete